MPKLICSLCIFEKNLEERIPEAQRNILTIINGQLVCGFHSAQAYVGAPPGRALIIGH
jgi:hypothetical protein